MIMMMTALFVVLVVGQKVAHELQFASATGFEAIQRCGA